MSVVVEVPSALSRYSDEERDVTVEGSSVAEVLKNLFQSYPRLRSRVLDRNDKFYPYLLLLQNDQKLPRSGLESIPVSNGDKLEIVALAEGG